MASPRMYLTLNSIKEWIEYPLRGASLIDKLRLVTFLILWSSRKLPIIGSTVQKAADSLVKGTVIQYRGAFYSLIDASTAYIFSHKFEPWIWRYLQSLRHDDVFIDVGHTLDSTRSMPLNS